MTSYALRNASPAKSKADAVVVGVLAGPGDQPARVAPGGEDVEHAYGRAFAPLLATLGVTGRIGEVTKVPTSKTIGSPLLVLVGLGELASPSSVRRAAGAAARAVTNAASVALALPADSAALAGAVLEGYRLGGYTFTAYKASGPGKSPAEVVVLSPVARQKETVARFETAGVLADAVCGTRDWVNTAPNDLRPPAFADQIADLVANRPRSAAKVTCTVLDETALAREGCGGLLGVGAGSDAPPRLVKLTYEPRDAGHHLALVGKGITFDTGGLSIKPASGMQEMKSDMAGAAAVVRATLAIADLGLPVRVTAYAALAENMVGAGAMRPGDVVTIHGGTTVEVWNTDAEGRLVLADALVMAVDDAPDLLLDVATLTGHMVVALGDKVSGVLGDDEPVRAVLSAAERAGEEMWHMPIPEVMRERVTSSRIADLQQHDWVRWGGGLYAAAFLREFVGGLPWAHLDIAGPAFNSGGPSGHVTSGGTGVAVTTLVEVARGLAAGS
ncbi:leucyl aminopeptidase [Nocardioides sp. R-C-SC26]|uniref:leucyl aminopeptidase n=1 Tax=Nocardioides sp. R-C-SC26 TaxID=2870414 RepID=UPI001E475A34|nr:leucyl aminopeptidase [Nocardioides sp. R-C-SC26]